ALDGCRVCLSVFFFQAEDGIRDWSVTGVQTCALPICFFRVSESSRRSFTTWMWQSDPAARNVPLDCLWAARRGRRACARDQCRGSEKRRVGEEGGARWGGGGWREKEDGGEGSRVVVR